MLSPELREGSRESIWVKSNDVRSMRLDSRFEYFVLDWGLPGMGLGLWRCVFGVFLRLGMVERWD